MMVSALFLCVLGAILCSTITEKVNTTSTPSITEDKQLHRNRSLHTNTSIFLTRARSALRQWKFAASLHHLAQCIRATNATRGEKLEASTLRARIHQAVGQILAGMRDAKVT